MLDEFIPSKPAELKAPTTYHPSKPPANTTVPPLPGLEGLSEGLSDDEFAAQLQAGMAELMGELDNSPDMQAQFENMLKGLALGEAAAPTPAPASTSAPKDKKAKKSKATAAAGSSNATEGSFQDTIAATMERMRTSGDQATAAAASDNTDDLLAEMMKAMQSGGLEGEGGEEEFSKMLMGMMEQLTNKEILYEPMKELDDKFPSWMEKNAGKVEEADMKRYKEQQTYVKEIVGRFEKKGYTDDNAADREYIVERMQKVCSDVGVLRLYIRLIVHRCKQQALHQQIWLEIWLQRKKRSEHLKRAVRRNDNNKNHARIKHQIPIPIYDKM